MGVNENAQELYPYFEDIGDEHRPDLFDVIGNLFVIGSLAIDDTVGIGKETGGIGSGLPEAGLRPNMSAGHRFSLRLGIGDFHGLITIGPAAIVRGQ